MASGKTALLVLDMENDIINLHPKDDHVRAVIATIADLIAWARQSGIPVVYSRIAHRPTYVDLPEHLRGMVVARKMLQETGPGTAIIDELAPHPGDPVVVKRRTGAFYGSDLEIVLRGLSARTLIFTGRSTTRVVESTVRQARDRDFDCIVASDGCMAGTPDLHESALKSMADWVARVMTAAEIKAALPG